VWGGAHLLEIVHLDVLLLGRLRLHLAPRLNKFLHVVRVDKVGGPAGQARRGGGGTAVAGGVEPWGTHAAGRRGGRGGSKRSGHMQQRCSRVTPAHMRRGIMSSQPFLRPTLTYCEPQEGPSRKCDGICARSLAAIAPPAAAGACQPVGGRHQACHARLLPRRRQGGLGGLGRAERPVACGGRRIAP